MDELIELINKYCSHLTDPSRYLHEVINEDKHGELEDMCCDIFIAEGGVPNFSAIRRLAEKTNFKVGPGEQDSFGWLTGVVHTPYGKLVYG